MANQYGINMGNVLAAKKFGDEQEDRKAAKQRNALLHTTKSAAAMGDEKAMAQLVALSPEDAKNIQAYMKSASDEERENFTYANQVKAQLAAGVLASKDPVSAYAQLRSSLPKDMQSALPETYEPDFLENVLAQATEIARISKSPSVVTFGDKDMLYQGGKKVGETQSNALIRSRESDAAKIKAAEVKANAAPGGLKSADENTIYRQTVELLGGLFDQQGNITTLDPTLRGKVQGIADEATRMFNAGEASTRTEAVSKAAQAYGVTIPGAGPQTNQISDPLGIRRPQ